MTNETIRKIAAFFALCAWIVGAIAGTIYASKAGNIFVGLCVLALAGMSFPTLRKLWKND